MVNAEVSRTGNENALATIRKFSRRVQGTGLIQRSRKRRYYSRNASKTVSKKRALKKIARREAFKKLVKEGKAPEPTKRGRPMAPRTTESQTQNTASRFGETTPIAR